MIVIRITLNDCSRGTFHAHCIIPVWIVLLQFRRQPIVVIGDYVHKQIVIIFLV